MAQFDESKIINALHPEKAEVGKKYWYADDLICLKIRIEHDSTYHGTLVDVGNNTGCPFYLDNCSWWKYLYPYEEPPKQRMTNRQLAEWLAKGNGEYTQQGYGGLTYFNYPYSTEASNEYVSDNIRIRRWHSDEWVEPTAIIYDRDCCGMNIVTKE